MLRKKCTLARLELERTAEIWPNHPKLAESNDRVTKMLIEIELKRDRHDEAWRHYDRLNDTDHRLEQKIVRDENRAGFQPGTA